jgi:hypothetical protein
VDYVEEVADFLGLYQVEAATEQALELARIVNRVGGEIAAALAKLPTLPGRSRRCSRAGSTRWS